MPKYCNTCNRPIKGKSSEHICEMAKLSNGRSVHLNRVTDPDGDVRQQIEEGEVTVVARSDFQPLKTLSEKLGLAKGKKPE